LTSVMVIQPSIFVHGGAERQISELCNYLVSKDYKTTLLTSSAIPEFKRSLRETRIVETGDLRNLLSAVRSLSYKFDIINPHNHPAELFPLPNRNFCIWQSNEPPEVILRGGEIEPRERDLVRKIVKVAMVISDYDKKRFEKVYGFSPIVNYPGVRVDHLLEKFTPKDKYNLRGSFVLLEAGYITWTKNQVKAVDILSEVKRTIPEAKLVLAGYDKDPYAQEVRKRIQDLNLSDSVIMTGYIRREEDFRDLMALSNLHIAPIADQGGWASLFQSLFLGLPILVSSHFIGADLVKAHDLGEVSPIEDFVSKILSIHDRLDREKERAKKGALWVKENLTWEKFGEKYAEVIENLT